MGGWLWWKIMDKGKLMSVWKYIVLMNLGGR